MARQKLSKTEINHLVIRFCQALAQIKNPEESSKFIVDLLSKSETEKLAIRLKVAEMLINEHTYNEINDKLKVGRSTVARVSEWLKIAGEGYRLIIQRMQNVKEIIPKKMAWSGIKKVYSQYYWPEKLLEEMVYNSTTRQKERLEKVLNKLDIKSDLFRSLSRILREKNRN